MGSGMIKVLSIVVTIAGAGLSLLNAFVDDKKMDEKIKEGIDKALAEKESEVKEEA